MNGVFVPAPTRDSNSVYAVHVVMKFVTQPRRLVVLRLVVISTTDNFLDRRPQQNGLKIMISLGGAALS